MEGSAEGEKRYIILQIRCICVMRRAHVCVRSLAFAGPHNLPSRYTTLGEPTIAQATLRRRFMPPENFPACTLAHLCRLTAARAVPGRSHVLHHINSEFESISCTFKTLGMPRFATLFTHRECMPARTDSFLEVLR